MNTKEFHISTGKELLAIKDRVRNLIYHWGEEGRYKEAVLKTVIERFLPSKYKIATGFVVKQTSIRGEHLASKQIDLLVYDTSYPVLFREADFVIVTADAVKAIIEVKANLENQGVDKVIEKANEIGHFIFEAKTNKKDDFYNGIFSYEGFNSINVLHLKEKIKNGDKSFKKIKGFHDFKVNHICFNKDLFYKYWAQELPGPPNFLYKIDDLAFSFFISNLMSYLGGTSVIDNANLWFAIDKSIKVLDAFKN